MVINETAHLITQKSHFYLENLADILSFQNFFKTWLLDGGTDQERLRLIIPSAFTQDSGSKSYVTCRACTRMLNKSANICMYSKNNQKKHE